MRLSEAIRLGSMLAPQGFVFFASGLSNPWNGTCALIAAADAVGAGIQTSGQIWPWIQHVRVVCPECNEGPRIVQYIIGFHLNDLHRWTRERIAEWVSTIEPPEVPEQVAEPELVAVRR